MSNAPCKGCVERSEKCHAECKRYNDFLKENERIKENREKDAINRSAIFRPKYHC